MDSRNKILNTFLIARTLTGIFAIDGTGLSARLHGKRITMS